MTMSNDRNDNLILEIHDLYVGYYSDLHILQGVNLSAERGKITTILGANGVGKSTLLKAVYGFLKPQQGRILLNGKDVTNVPTHKLIERGVSYIPQQPGVFPYMTVEENLLMGAWTFRHDRRRTQQKLDENYARFPVLAERRNGQAGELSGGQKRMVEIGRTLMTDPELMLVDEPTAGLAKLVSLEIYRMLTMLAQEVELTIVLVDQEIRQALAIADYVFVLDLGRNRSEGNASDFANLEESFWS